jgi:hypothetical protein
VAVSGKGYALTGTLVAGRRRRSDSPLVKQRPGDAGPVVVDDLLFSAAAPPSGNYTLTALGGTYTLTGGSAVIERDRRLTANGGSYTLTGASANLNRNRRLTANGGAYTYTGASAILEKDRRLTAVGGAYTYTGAQANITYTPGSTGYVLTALGGSYTLTGGSAIIERDRRLTAQGGAYAYTGGTAIVEKDRRLTAQGGAYALAGGDAVITKTSPGAYVLTALGGTYTLSGANAAINVSGGDDPFGGVYRFRKILERKRQQEEQAALEAAQQAEQLAKQISEQQSEPAAVIPIAKPVIQAKDTTQITRTDVLIAYQESIALIQAEQAIQKAMQDAEDEQIAQIIAALI